jgi:16S rRNA processing protein RimM
MADRILVAEIGAAHGTRGEVRLRSFTQDPLAVKDYGALESEDGARTFTIERVRPAKDCLVARIAGVADRTAAERLRNTTLYVGRDRLPAPADEEFYHADLIGLVALAADGSELGKVVAVHNFGAGDLIELRTPNNAQTELLPFDALTVPEVNVAQGYLIIEIPATDTELPTPLSGRPAAKRSGGG